MHRRSTVAFAVALAACLGARSALADDVPPPPEDCPPGARGETDHAGPHCEPASCKDDSGCRPEQVCAYYPQCVKRMRYESNRGNWHANYSGEPCSADAGACPANYACEAEPVCVPRNFLASGKARSLAGGKPPSVGRGPAACTCDLPAGAGPVGMSLATLACAAAVLLRRRRGARSPR